MTNNLVGNLHQTYSHAYQAINDGYQQAGQYVSQKSQEAADSVYNTYSHAYQTINGSCQQVGQYVSQKSQEAANNIYNFTYANKDKIFFAGCCAATAYFAPQLFFTAAVATAITRVELTSHLKQLANEYLKDERNPYKLNPRYDDCVSTLDLTMGSIAVVDAIALGTLFTAATLPVAILPALGGIAAGSCAAKLAMNVVNF